ncbi:MAG: sulfotransferase [Thermoleophilia bacterium]|nr:sulfotransferase [Thermoleophilia bacterium]
MRREQESPDEDGDPLDAALGDLHDLADLEQRFAQLDARLGDVDAARATDTPAGGLDAVVEDDDDPFSDIARALREHRRSSDDPGDDDAGPRGLTRDDDSSDSMDEDQDSSDEDDDEIDEVSNEIEARCQDALDALEIDDLSLAREIALGAVRLDDEHPFPMFVLGLVAEQEGDLDTARDMAELSLRTAGTNPDAIGLRAHIHVRQHELEQAEELLRFGIAHNPDEATLHEGLARVALARGRHAEALDAAMTALRIEPGNPGAMAVRTAALDEAGDSVALLAALRQGVQLHPEDPYGMVELASAEMEHGNLERARVLLMRAQRLAPRDQEIGNVRALVEHVYERPLLRPVPGLLRWMRDFPGGLAGFLIGFVVAALPLHALATTNPEYRIPALTVIVAWGSVALYAWIAPAIITRRLNQRAARSSADRLAEELRDPLATPPGIERIADVVGMLVTARDRRRAHELLALAARRTESHGSRQLAPNAHVAAEVAPGLTHLARRLASPRARMRGLLLAIPGAPRLVVALAVAAAVGAPAFATLTVVPLLGWHAMAVGLLLVAWLLTIIEARAERDLDDAFVALQLTATTAASAGASGVTDERD